MDIILWSKDDGSVVAFTPPGGMKTEDARLDVELVPQDRPTFVVDHLTLPQNKDIRCWRLDAQGTITIDATIESVINIAKDQSNLDNISRKDKALLLAAALLAGKTPAQAKAAFKTAREALAPAQGGGK